MSHIILNLIIVFNKCDIILVKVIVWEKNYQCSKRFEVEWFVIFCYKTIPMTATHTNIGHIYKTSIWKCFRISKINRININSL